MAYNFNTFPRLLLTQFSAPHLPKNTERKVTGLWNVQFLNGKVKQNINSASLLVDITASSVQRCQLSINMRD